MTKTKTPAFIEVTEGISEVSVIGLFQPQTCDIEEEFGNNEALRQYNNFDKENELGTMGE